MGARFEALCNGVLMAASDFSCNLFGILTSGFEQSGGEKSILRETRQNKALQKTTRQIQMSHKAVRAKARSVYSTVTQDKIQNKKWNIVWAKKVLFAQRPSYYTLG